ncbi:MAG: hypothetical protein JNG84_08285 [Archangium sp.]|nr:hypothetical protein [Archangium sp.]
MNAKQMTRVTAGMRALLISLMLSGLPAQAQDACESRCNQASAECLRTCTAPNGTTDGKAQSSKMMQCLNTCEAQAKPCRERCRPAPQPAPEKKP